MKRHWRYSVACGSCLSVVALAWSPRDLEPIAGSTAVIAPGSVIARLRERLVAANEAGTIRPEVGRLLSDESYRVLLGVPELFPEIAPGIGRRLRLRTNAKVVPASEIRPEALADQPVPLGKFGSAISREELATAIVGEGVVADSAASFGETGGREPGGVLRVPLAWETRFVVLTGTRLALAGIRNGGLLVQPPPWVAAVIGSSPFATVPWGLATRESE